MERVIDLRSDTVTKPTEAMRKASKNAIVGDDVFGDDPSVNKLEEYAAELMGKEAALFVSSGTQGNLVSILTHTSPGDEVLLETDSHIFYYEVGGLSAVGGAIPKLFESNRGYIPADELAEKIRPKNIHYPDTSLLCLENTHNRHGGVALSPRQIAEMAEVGRDHGLGVHMDGARIFNAAVAHDVDLKEYTRHVDSIQFCLSKGLSAPVGSMIAADEEFIARARKKRKMLGGGMRQAGVIAAPGLVALRDMRGRLTEDHHNAKILSEGLTELGVKVWPTQTNIVVCDVSEIFEHSSEGIELLAGENILTVPFSEKLIRMTTNRHVTYEDIKYSLKMIEELWFVSQ